MSQYDVDEDPEHIELVMASAASNSWLRLPKLDACSDPGGGPGPPLSSGAAAAAGNANCPTCRVCGAGL